MYSRVGRLARALSQRLYGNGGHSSEDGLWAERKSKTQPIHIHISGSGGNRTTTNYPK